MKEKEKTDRMTISLPQAMSVEIRKSHVKQCEKAGVQIAFSAYVRKILKEFLEKQKA